MVRYFIRMQYLREPELTTKDTSLHAKVVEIGVEILLLDNVQSQLFNVGAIAFEAASRHVIQESTYLLGC